MERPGDLPRRGGPALAVVLGTGTAVGKTWVGAHLAAELQRRGVTVRLRKPLQSGEPGEQSDAEVLAAASGEALQDVCAPAWSYELAMAPPMAADALARPCPALADVVSWLEPARRDPRAQVLVVETVGGVRSPCCSGADSLDLAAALEPDALVLVADAGLGTINAVRLSLEALTGNWPGAHPHRAPVLVHLNRYDDATDLHRRNRAWLESGGVTPTVSIADLAERLLGGASPPEAPPPRPAA